MARTPRSYKICHITQPSTWGGIAVVDNTYYPLVPSLYERLRRVMDEQLAPDQHGVRDPTLVFPDVLIAGDPFFELIHSNVIKQFRLCV